MLPVGAAAQRITHAYTMDVGTRRVAARGPINLAGTDRLRSVICMLVPRDARALVYNSITGMELRSPEALGNLEDPDDFHEISSTFEETLRPHITRAWSFCTSRVKEAARRGTEPSFPSLPVAEEDWGPRKRADRPLDSQGDPAPKIPRTHVSPRHPTRVGFASARRPPLPVAGAATRASPPCGKVVSPGAAPTRMPPKRTKQAQPTPTESNDVASKGPAANEVESVIWATSSRWRTHSPIFGTSERLGLSDRQTLVTIAKAIRNRLRTDKSVIAAAKHMNAYVDHVSLLETDTPGIRMHGFDAHVALSRFLESLRPRGRTVPASARSAIEAWNDALSLELPIRHRAVMAECQDAVGGVPRQAPMMPVEFVRKLEESAMDASLPLARRAFCAGLLLMTFGSFRFDDTKHLGDLRRSNSAIHGVLSSTKNKKKAPEPWAVPAIGISGADGWAEPIFSLRAWMEKEYGFLPPFIFPDVSNDWTQVATTAASYASVRRRMTTLAEAWEIAGAETLTLHSPRNLLPSLGCQQGISREARTRLGHWDISSSMPERYNRLACVDELRIRSDILRLLSSGWAPVGPFEVPTPARVPGLGGNAPGGSSADGEDLKVGHGTAYGDDPGAGPSLGLSSSEDDEPEGDDGA